MALFILVLPGMARQQSGQQMMQQQKMSRHTPSMTQMMQQMPGKEGMGMMQGTDNMVKNMNQVMEKMQNMMNNQEMMNNPQMEKLIRNNLNK